MQLYICKPPSPPVLDVSSYMPPASLTLPGEYADGMRQLCYSLRQIQYLQHYIYESRLTDPNHVNNRKQPAEDPEDNEKPIRHIPIPAGLIPAESFKSVVSIEQFLLTS